MIGIIYITENLTNGKRYIGQHECSEPCPDDGYLGSGKIIKAAIKKDGKENFKRITLHVVEDGESLDEAERYYIKIYNAVEREDFYNISDGGSGKTSEEARRLALKAWQDDEYRTNHLKGIEKRFANETEEEKQKRSDDLKARWKDDSFRNKVMTGINSKETKEKMSKATSGANNPRALAVYCEEEPDIIYSYAKEASIKLNINYSSLMNHLEGYQKSAGKMPDGSLRHWHYADEEKEKEALKNREIKYRTTRDAENKRRRDKRGKAGRM